MQVSPAAYVLIIVCLTRQALSWLKCCHERDFKKPKQVQQNHWRHFNNVFIIHTGPFPCLTRAVGHDINEDYIFTSRGKRSSRLECGQRGGRSAWNWFWPTYQNQEVAPVGANTGAIWTLCRTHTSFHHDERRSWWRELWGGGLGFWGGWVKAARAPLSMVSHRCSSEKGGLKHLHPFWFSPYSRSLMRSLSKSLGSPCHVPGIKWGPRDVTKNMIDMDPHLRGLILKWGGQISKEAIII